MKQDFKDVTRGGQTFLHALRMINQILRMVVFSSLLFFVLTAGAWFMSHTTTTQRGYYGHWLMAKFFYTVSPRGTQQIKNNQSKRIKVYNRDILASSAMQENASAVYHVLKVSLWLGLGVSLPIALGTLYWFARRGKAIEETELVKGRYVATAKELNQLIRKTGQVGDLVFADINLYRNAEKQHFLVCGTTGTGKSFLIGKLLTQIRSRKNKAIVYDKHGSFIQRFYNPETDIILNPMDARCAPWDIWAECRDEADFDSMAAALMPMPPSQSTDPFWINAARTIFASLAYRMKKQTNRSTKTLLSHLFTSELETLAEMLKGTEAETLVSDKTAKTALSVKSVLATYLKSLKYLKHAEKPFSIREWVSDDSKTGWLFISSRADRHESIKPLISSWLDGAANALMSLPANEDRRFWMVIDELASLQRLPYLPEAFAESRKFGGCLVAGLQNYFQLQETYGQDGAKKIIDLCNIRAFFRAPSNDAAKWVSREIGEAEQLEAREGISYGANTVRDGVTLSHQTVTRPAVSSTEMTNLPDLQCFVSVPPLDMGNDKRLSDAQKKTHRQCWPVASVSFEYQQASLLQPAYLELPEDEAVSSNDDLWANYEADAAKTQKKPRAKKKAPKQIEPEVVMGEGFDL